MFKLRDAAHRANAGAHAAPVGGVVVGAGPQDVLASTVVRVLVEDPVALHHVAGGDTTHLELVLEIGAVLTQFHHLASKVAPLKELQAEGAIVLLSVWRFFKIFFSFQANCLNMLYLFSSVITFHLCICYYVLSMY